MSVVFQVRAIKPAKMNITAVRNELLMALQYEGEDVRAQYQKTTASWNRRVQFEIVTDITGNDASVLVGTDDKVYRYVDEGTRPHPIRPRRARMLRFQSGYRAKTKVGHIGSFAGGKFGPVVFAHAVQHPGTQARRFTPIIQQRRKDKFRKRMLDAVRRGAEQIY